MCSNDIFPSSSNWTLFSETSLFTPAIQRHSSINISDENFHRLEKNLMNVMAGNSFSEVYKQTEKSCIMPLNQEMKRLNELFKFKKVMEKKQKLNSEMKRILEKEISQVWKESHEKETSMANSKEGPIVRLTEKLFVPVNPEYNFVGRLIGPRGQTSKQLTQETGCSISVRGRGSMKDKMGEERLKIFPKWDHLNKDLHVLIQCEDTERRAKEKMAKAVEMVTKLMVPKKVDEEKDKQLQELAILNGTYGHRTNKVPPPKEATIRRKSPVTLRFVEVSKPSLVTLKFV